jgi:hypothetical protein
VSCPDLLCLVPGCLHLSVYLERSPSLGPGTGRWATRWGRPAFFDVAGEPVPSTLSWSDKPLGMARRLWLDMGPPPGARFVCPGFW